MDKSQDPPHVPMDTSSIVLTPVLGQTPATVSFDTDTLIAAHQGAAWKISGWPDNITIHHAKGCACYHEYINHLLGDEHGCQSQHVSNSNSTSIKHLSLLPSLTASSQPTLPCSIHHLSSIIHHQWQLLILSLLNHHLDFPDIQ